MDPPSLDEEIPQPQARMEPEPDSSVPDPTPSYEMPSEDPPLPPPPAASANTSKVEEKIQNMTLNDEKKDESLANANSEEMIPVSSTLVATTTTPGGRPAEEDAEKEQNPNTNKDTNTNQPPAAPETPTRNTAAAPPAVFNTPSKEDDTPIMMPLSPKERSVSFEELRSYEAKRRAIYLKKLKSSSLYWRAFRDTLSKSYQETERAESMIRGSVVANQAYAEYLAGAAEDRLDYSGRPMDEKKAKRHQNDKDKKYHTLGGGSLLWGVAFKDQKKNEEEEKKKLESNGALVQNVSFEGLPNESVLTKFIESHQQMAEKFHENFKFVKEVALEKMVQLRKELEAEVNVMSMLGDVTIYELEKAEDDVQKAWEAYYTLACMGVQAHQMSPRTNKAKTNVDKNAVTDVWLVEMHYRMSVAYLTTVWEKCSAELSNLFASMKELECNRRFRLNELLILYMQRAERLWLSVPSMVTAVTQDLVSIPTDTDTIEKQVQTTIRDKAQIFQRKESASMKADPMNAPGLAGVPDLKEGYELQSPLMSDLLGKAQVIWRKNEKLMSVWKPTLAIATSDCYLHLFDIPHYSNVQTGTAPEVAFQALVPPVKIPTEDELVNGHYPFGTNWYDNLVPTDSIDLRCSKITFSETKGNSTFELTEVLAPNKFSSVSNFTRKKKLALRMYSSQHMVEWLLAMKNYGAE